MCGAIDTGSPTATAARPPEDPMDEKQLALDYFRKLVSFLYREVGAMKPENHKELYAKARMDKSGFAIARKELAKEFYYQTASDESTQLIVQPYQEQTGLSLEDVYRVFEEGDWLLGRRSYSYGGPRWAMIAKTTLELNHLIETGDWEKVPDLVEEWRSLES